MNDKENMQENQQEIETSQEDVQGEAQEENEPMLEESAPQTTEQEEQPVKNAQPSQPAAPLGAIDQIILKVSEIWSSISNSLNTPISKPSSGQGFMQTIKDSIGKLFGGGGNSNAK